MSQEDIDSIERQIQRLKNRKAAVLAKDADAERRRRTRQNIIIGAWVQRHQQDMIEIIKSTLTRPQDISAFQASQPRTKVMSVDIILPSDGEYSGGHDA